MNDTFSLDSLLGGLFGGGGTNAAPHPVQQWFGDWKVFSPSELPWAPETTEFWDTLTGRKAAAKDATSPGAQTSFSGAPSETARPTVLGEDPLVPKADAPTFKVTPSPTEMPDGAVEPVEVPLFPPEATPVEARTALVAKTSIAADFKRTNAPKISLNNTWTSRDATWAKLNPHERVAVMSLMESGDYTRGDTARARNAAAAMHNRAAKYGIDVGYHVSSRHYQPTFEENQYARLGSVLKSKAYQEMVAWSQRYAAGQEIDPTNGATHFLVHPKTMLALEAREPMKYRSWRKWTGFDQSAMAYRNQTITDNVHAFLSPEGRYSLGRQFRK